MPINCPIPILGPCDGCLKHHGDHCNWYSLPIPLRDILTPDERIDSLEVQIAKFEKIVPSTVMSQMGRDLNDTRNMLAYLKNKIDEHLAPEKRKKLQKATDKKEDGVTPV